jgi:hypothetical protein
LDCTVHTSEGTSDTEGGLYSSEDEEQYGDSSDSEESSDESDVEEEVVTVVLPERPPERGGDSRER